MINKLKYKIKNKKKKKKKKKKKNEFFGIKILLNKVGKVLLFFGKCFVF